MAKKIVAAVQQFDAAAQIGGAEKLAGREDMQRGAVGARKASFYGLRRCFGLASVAIERLIKHASSTGRCNTF